MTTAGTAQLRKEIRSMVRELPESELHAIKRFIQFVTAQAEHPAIVAMRNAPIKDDEPLTEEDREQIRQAREDICAGRFLTHEEVLRKHLV